MMLAIAASVAVGWMLGAQRNGPTGTPSIDSEASAKIHAGGRLVGSEQAEMEVVVFADYFCEQCAMLHQLLEDARSVWGERLAIRYRHYPLIIAHPQAVEAATSVECGAEQRRFTDIQAATFRATTDTKSSVDWDSVAIAAGVVDIQAFRACRVDPLVRSRIEVDRQLAIDLALLGTPAIFVGTRAYYSVDVVEVIARALGRSRRTPVSTFDETRAH
jgi:protein-disulfide isomerase